MLFPGENQILGVLPATNSGAPYLAFFARCGKFNAVSRQLLEISLIPKVTNGQGL